MERDYASLNAAISFIHEHRANQALFLLRHRLSVQARVRRDGRWQVIPAQELVPGDVIHLRMGDLVPAVVRVVEGQVVLDQSALTAESLPIEASAGASVYAGAFVKRGEATGEVRPFFWVRKMLLLGCGISSQLVLFSGC